MGRNEPQALYPPLAWPASRATMQRAPQTPFLPIRQGPRVTMEQTRAARLAAQPRRHLEAGNWRQVALEDGTIDTPSPDYIEIPRAPERPEPPRQPRRGYSYMDGFSFSPTSFRQQELWDPERAESSFLQLFGPPLVRTGLGRWHKVEGDGSSSELIVEDGDGSRVEFGLGGIYDGQREAYVAALKHGVDPAEWLDDVSA